MNYSHIHHINPQRENLKLALFCMFLQAVLLFGLVTVISILAAPRANAMGLKQNAVLEKDLITLGDIFYDLPRDAEKVLGPAPRPGQDMTLNARTLMRIALALDLPWRPSSSDERIVLRRAATLIEGDAVKAALRESIKSKGFPGKFDVAVPEQTSGIILPKGHPATVEVVKLELDPDRGTFRAEIAAPSAANPIMSLPVSGAIHRIVDVPVLKNALRAGDIIGARDIETIEVRAQMVNAGTILNPEDLKGMTPRRMILAGKPIADNDLQSPQIVSRGGSVTMVFSDGPLTLTAQGRALENGAKGDIVRVVNNSSKRSVEAVVTAENEVRVEAF